MTNAEVVAAALVHELGREPSFDELRAITTALALFDIDPRGQYQRRAGGRRMTEPLRFDNAPCAGVGALFFPELGASSGPDVKNAKALCRTCPYLQPCLEYALENRELHGVWGGTTVRERRRIIRDRDLRRNIPWNAA